MNNVTSRSTATNVPLLFLFKKGDEFANLVRGIVKQEHRVLASYVYYADPSKNTKAKWKITPRELRIEFYLNILHDFSAPRKNVFGVYTGLKCMLAAKVGRTTDL